MKRLRLWNNYFWMKLRRWNQVIKKAVITFIFLSRLLLSLHHARHLDVSFCCSASSTSRDARNKSMLVRSCEHRHSRTDRDTCGDTSRHTNRQTERHINTQRHLDVSFCCNTSSTSQDATNKSILVRSCEHRHRRSDTGGHTGRQAGRHREAIQCFFLLQGFFHFTRCQKQVDIGQILWTQTQDAGRHMDGRTDRQTSNNSSQYKPVTDRQTDRPGRHREIYYTCV